MKQLKSTLLLVFCASQAAQANVIQYFTGISYSNPAELFQTKDTSVLLGGTYFDPDLRFRGTSLNFLTATYPYGEVHSRKKSVLPYGRIAKRVSPNLVLGIDLTEPFHSNLDWGTDSFTNYAATQNYLYDIDISPRLSAKLREDLFFGFGFNFNYLYHHEANWAIPDFATGNYANLVNKSSNLGIGFNLGLFYMINPQNMLGITYYSKIKQPTYGTSYLGPLTSNNLDFTFNMPATTVVSYLHFFSQKWLANFKLFYAQWSINQSVRFMNTAAPPPIGPNFTFKTEYGNAFALIAATHYQYNDKLGLLAFAMYDEGPEREHLRPLIFPADNIYFAGIGADYKINKTTTVELVYGHAYEGTRLNNTVNTPAGTLPFNRGNVTINADAIDFRIKYET